MAAYGDYMGLRDINQLWGNLGFGEEERLGKQIFPTSQLEFAEDKPEKANLDAHGCGCDSYLSCPLPPPAPL